VFDFNKRLIDEYDGGIDWNAIHGLIEEFLDSDEAGPYKTQGSHWLPLVIEYALIYEVATLAEITPRVMQTVLFGLFPEKVSTEPESAPAIIEETRAFWQFLQTKYALKHAADVVAMLDANAETRLRRELADPSNYGMAKSFFMAGQAAGFDMTTQEGMNEFMAVYNARLGMPPLPPPPGNLVIGDLDEDDFDEEDFDEVVPREKKEPLFGPQHSPKERAEMRKKKRKAKKRNN
jgi:hypothetical protein